MKPDLLRRLRCPCCGSRLSSHPIATRSFGEGASLYHAVEAGVLACDAGCAWFPVINFVPVLLDFRVPLHQEFRERHRQVAIPAFDLPYPSGAPRPGEVRTQESFTIEWSGLGQDRHTFVFSIEERERHIQAELDWPPFLLDRPAGAPPLLVLDVGAGFGLEPAYLRNALGEAEVIGIDLNLSLLESGPEIAAMPGVHTVIASLFAPPFEERGFDLVYSNGVIHHTYSTHAALVSIERFRRPGGAIYIWIYAAEDFFQLTWKGRIQYALEMALRPSFAKLPKAMQNLLLYPLALRNLRVSRKAMGRGREWTLKNALHDTRDKWTPVHAHRHRFNEVLRWFAELGLEARPVDPVAIQPHLPISVIGIGVRGTDKPSPVESQGG